jgi:hypothetical protein
MTFNETDPTTWSDPQFHPDFGVDSALSMHMLRECSIDLLSKVPNITTRLFVDTDDAVLYCEIATEVEVLGELYCVEPLNTKTLRYGFFTEDRDSTKELEFYADNAVDVCRIVLHVQQRKNLESLQEEFGGSM